MVTPTIRGRLLQCEASSGGRHGNSMNDRVGDARLKRLGLRSPLSIFCAGPRSNWVEHRLNCNPPQSSTLILGRTSGSREGALVSSWSVLPLDPPSTMPFWDLGSRPHRRRSPRRLTGHSAVRLRDCQCPSNFAQHFPCRKALSLLSRAGQTCCADVEQKASRHTSCHKLPDQGAATDSYIE